MSKMTMVTNQRDKNLLILLAVAVIAFICYYFIINPALIKGDELSLQVSGVRAELARSTDLVAQYPTLILEEKKQKQILIEKYKMFFYDLNQERILYKLDSLIAGAGFTIDTYSVAPLTASPILYPIPQYTPVTYPLLDLASKANPSLIPQAATQAVAPETPVADSNTQDNPTGEPAPAPTAPPVSTDAIGTADITLGFSAATYEAAMSFLKALEDMDKSVIVRNISIAKAETGISGQIILSFYTLPKVDETDKDELKFIPVIPLGKANPFN